jgi:hypothetical protein
VHVYVRVRTSMCVRVGLHVDIILYIDSNDKDLCHENAYYYDCLFLCNTGIHLHHVKLD